MSIDTNIQKIAGDYRRHNGGFTLIETVVAITVGAVIASFLLVIGTEGFAAIRSIKRTERLHANATNIMNTAGYWIKQGTFFSTPDGATILITLPDETTKTLTRTGSAVVLDGVPVTTSDVAVENFSVTPLERSFRISFALGISGAPETFSATTTIAQRN